MRHVLLALPMDPSPQSDRDLPMGDVLDKSALYGGIMRRAYRRDEGMAGREGDESMPHYPPKAPLSARSRRGRGEAGPYARSYG